MRFVLSIVLVLIASYAEAGPKVVFSGLPLVLAIDAGVSREAKPIPAAEAKKSEVIVTEDNGEYFWASRENKRLIRVENARWITFVAPGGEGYIKIAKPETVEMLREGIEGYPFTYMEHMTSSLSTYTYFGSER